MSEAMAIVVGSFALVTAMAFVAAHYHREQMRRKLLRQMGRHHDWRDWNDTVEKVGDGLSHEVFTGRSTLN
ncbi:hypothetical protein [Paraburkholderia sediminicola]|uniref:hypothetical protein n=1 Tax=Paraburkholderia sediminicola TaxID=458836 RepID=UPI0038BDA392